MRKVYKTEEKLTRELAGLRQPVAELETSETGCKQAEEALRESEEFSSSLLNNSPHPTLVINPDTSIRYVNPALYRLTGFTPAEVIGKKAPYPWWTEETLQKTSRDLKEAMRKGAVRIEELFQKKNRERFWVEITSAPVTSDGEFKYYLANWVDITKRKQVENELRKFKAISDKAGYGITIVDLEGNVSYVNMSFARMHGYTPDELIGKHLSIFHTEQQIVNVNRLIEKLKREGSFVAEELGHKRKDNTEFTTSMNGTLVKDENGNPLFMAGTAVDITERKQVEEALQAERNNLRESEEKYRTIFENVSEVIIRVDRYGKIVDINGRTEECFGYKPEEVIGKNFAKMGVLSLKDLTKMVKLFGEIIRGKRAPFIVELEAKRKDGSPILIEVNSKLVKKNGKAEGFVAIVRDITERKQVEEALQAEKNKLQSVVDAIEYSLTIMDKDFNIIYQSQPSITTGDYYLGEKCYRVYEGQEKVCDGCPVEKAFKDGKSHTAERRIVLPSGEAQFLENTASPIRDASGKITSCLEVTRDITQRKQMEEELRESEEKYRSLVNNVKSGVFRSTPEPAGRFLEVNPAMAEITGYSRKELLNMNVSDLYVNPEERKVILEKIASGRGKPTWESRLRKQDGTEIVISDTKVAVRDDAGKVIYFDGILEDITERKQAEEREKELQRELLLSSRLASIGELAAGVAHQINNPLTGILGFSQRLLRKSTDQEFSQDLQRIFSEAERAAKVVQNLLIFARRREVNKQYSDINEIVKSALELRAYELKTSNIEAVTDLAPSLPQIMVDFHQIQETFLNIILNAEQAMTEANSGGRLTIKTEERKGYIRTTFTDDGPGIPAENLDKLFDPFFSTRGERGGTGLGLSVCHGIITEHGGRIYAKSKPGKGATFFVELPFNTSVGERGG